jgi:hypothetical protein
MAPLARLCAGEALKNSVYPSFFFRIERARFARKNDCLVAPYPRNLAL